MVKAEPPPNFILFSQDDALTEDTWEVAYDQTILPSGARNPNGCRPPMTWFTNCCAHGKPSSTCGAVQIAHKHGHEVSTHTMTHSRDSVAYDYEEWVAEVDGQRKWVVDECGIPREAVVGFRAPYFATNNLLGRVISDLGFLYDSSLKGEDLFGTGAVLRAGRLNGSFHPNCVHSRSSCDGWAGLPFWEVPAYMPRGHGDHRSDPEPVDGMSIMQRYQADFERKRGTGIPVAVLVHAPYMRNSTHRKAVTAFLGWALAQPSTWAVTYAQYVAWMQAGGRGANMTTLAASFPCDSS